MLDQEAAGYEILPGYNKGILDGCPWRNGTRHYRRRIKAVALQGWLDTQIITLAIRPGHHIGQVG